MEDGEKYKWYSIPVPYYAASDDDAEAEAEAEAEKKLSPFSVVELPKLHSFVALKSSIYCLGGSTIETWIFYGCCWKLGPQMNVRRFCPHTVVLGGKLCVLGGLYADAREEYIWMEVLNPKRRAWRPLPNPPLRISYFGMVSVALERTKQIIVSAFLRGDSKVYRCYDYDSGRVVYINDVRTCCWTELEPLTIDLHCGSRGGFRDAAYFSRFNPEILSGSQHTFQWCCVAGWWCL
nr:f-box/kelch-repeat protein [Quercus suber]